MSEGMVLAVAVALAVAVTTACIAGLMAYVQRSERHKKSAPGAQQ